MLLQIIQQTSITRANRLRNRIHQVLLLRCIKKKKKSTALSSPVSLGTQIITQVRREYTHVHSFSSFTQVSENIII